MFFSCFFTFFEQLAKVRSMGTYFKTSWNLLKNNHSKTCYFTLLPMYVTYVLQKNESIIFTFERLFQKVSKKRGISWNLPFGWQNHRFYDFCHGYPWKVTFLTYLIGLGHFWKVWQLLFNVWQVLTGLNISDMLYVGFTNVHKCHFTAFYNFWSSFTAFVQDLTGLTGFNKNMTRFHQIWSSKTWNLIKMLQKYCISSGKSSKSRFWGHFRGFWQDLEVK